VLGVMGCYLAVGGGRSRRDRSHVVEVWVCHDGESQLVHASPDQPDLAKDEPLEPPETAVHEEQRVRCLDEPAGERDALDAMDVHSM